MTPDQRKSLKKQHREKYGLTQEEIDAIEIPSLNSTAPEDGGLKNPFGDTKRAKMTTVWRRLFVRAFLLSFILTCFPLQSAHFTLHPFVFLLTYFVFIIPPLSPLAPHSVQPP